MYAELHAGSAFSFLEGASLPEEMAEVCAGLELPAMALLDRDGVYGAPRFHQAMKKAGAKAHIGAEITLGSGKSSVAGRRSSAIPEMDSSGTDGWEEEGLQIPRYARDDKHSRYARDDKHSRYARDDKHSRYARDDKYSRYAREDKPSRSKSSGNSSSLSRCLGGGFARLPLLVESRTGYQNLCRLATAMKLRVPKNEPCNTEEHELAQHAAGLICLTGGDDGPLARALRHGGRHEARRAVERLTAIFGRENVYVELQRHFTREEEWRNQVAVEIARELGLPLLATNGVEYAQAPEREILDALTCIRNHCRLDGAGRLLARNAERHIKPAAAMARLFADLPEAIANTLELSARLAFTMNDLGYEFPRYPVPEGDTMNSFLRKRTEEGFQSRYGRTGTELRQRAWRQVERELALIEKLDLAGYFLIVWDIIRFCRENNILVQGRGSAANSAVCYSLGITAVDPVGMDLLFERFLSEERGEWPDIDLDLPSGDQRERAIQYVYQRYGKLGAAMTANVITYRGRSAAREMGKVLGFDGETLDRLSKVVGSWEYRDPKDTLERQFNDAGFDLAHARIRKFFQLCLAVQDLPRHLGQHSGGMVVCQGQLNSVVPLEPASMPGRVVVQWDKDDCADMGIIKVDLLGLGMMAVLEECLETIPREYGEEVDLAHLPADDPAVYAALQKADTVGMFQIESRAQMSCLPRLRPKKFYDIVVQVAIIRPGPIVGNMVHPYLKRRQGREPVVYPHPSLEPVLARTLGVPLFQEQLLRMAMIAAGFTGGEAEELRRAFGFKRSEKRMAEIEVKLRRGMERTGIDPTAQEQIIQSITSFALYGFPESHSASFALIAYASAYLKTHYLAAFTAALLNNQPMGFYHPSSVVKDAQRHGLLVRPIDVMKSEWLCTLEQSSVAGRRSSATPELDSSGSDSSLAQELQVPRYARDDNTISSFEFQVSSEDNAPPHHEKRETGNQKPSFALRMGLRYIKGLREEAGRAMVRERERRPFTSMDDLARRVPELSKADLAKLAEAGALNSIGDRQLRLNEAAPAYTKKFHRRDALWQVARAAQPVGPLLHDIREPDTSSPLRRMSDQERLVADFRRTGLTVGPHPMAYRRRAMDKLGVLRAGELPHVRNGAKVKVAGTVIARQRPGTAKGFVFLSLEDETGIANAIITPDIFQQNRLLLTSEHFLLIEGTLQNLDNVISVKADRVSSLRVSRAKVESHDFH